MTKDYLSGEGFGQLVNDQGAWAGYQSSSDPV